MPQEIVMPKLGDTMEEGTIVRWLVGEGDWIRRGQIIMEVSTDKAVVEVESFVEGKLLKILVADDQVLPVGAVVAWVGAEGEQQPR